MIYSSQIDSQAVSGMSLLIEFKTDLLGTNNNPYFDMAKFVANAITCTDADNKWTLNLPPLVVPLSEEVILELVNDGPNNELFSFDPD